LEAQRAKIEARKATCRLLGLNANELGRELLLREQRAIAQALVKREAPIWEVLRNNFERLGEWPRALHNLTRLISGFEELGWFHWVLLGVAVLSGTLAGLVWRSRAPRLAMPEGELPYTTNLWLATRAVLRTYAPLFLSLLVINSYLLVLNLLDDGPALFSKLAVGALVLMLLVMLSRVLLDPPAPATSLLKVNEASGRPLSRLLQLLSLLILIGLLLGELGRMQVIEHMKLLLLAQFFILAMAVNVSGLIHYANREGTGGKRILRRGLPALAVIVMVVAMWLGYVNLSMLVLHGSAGTLLAVFGLNLLSRLIEDLQDGLDTGRYAWQRSVRRAIGLAHDEPVPGLGWLLLVLQVLLWVLFVVVLLRVWGLPPQVIDSAGRLLTDGFQVGAVNIVPSRIFWAVLVLMLMLTTVRWIRGQLESRWLLRTRMERGAREAVATSFGYAGIAAVIMLSLSMAGIDFSNLAIIAGALSVGIGFGLQNVVNNFISGLIMLFERPVKTGDWIVVGTTEGYVRRISIRTTTIETFDRSEVIVPNSELISNQVTNWMHNNNYGRFKVPVGVAYGSDTEKVREVLLQVAKDHPKVVRGFPSWPDPWVLFIGFGDSSLNFELRGIVYNVDTRLSVISDLNFAIDKAFREHGIEIPFPQRVVHMAKDAEPEDKPPNPPTTDNPAT
jgi:small-conductance mechanosensitive channel